MNDIHMRRFRNIPPLQYLMGFEAAARLESFSKAANELGLSQSAISHEMRLLEERVGQLLFIRHGRSVRLTDAGRDYQRSVGLSLENLEAGYRRLEPYRKSGSVVIYAPRDFAARWLLPRLQDLRKEIPSCEPWIDTSGAAIDFENREISIAIMRAREIDPAFKSIALFEDKLVAVASPKLVPQKLKKPAELLFYPLIHDERTEGWSDWFTSAGVETADISAGLDFSDSDLALQAAERGLGIALVSLPLIQSSLIQSALIQPQAHVLQTGHTWYAVSTAKELNDPITQQVWNWLSALATNAKSEVST